ncbi:hypothetical protein BBD35_08105 [Elizabethkingia meningoseptica]|uniref:hypothetical protein n=1 Tax=Bacteroidota TaxID=976 RepID=UPI0008418DE8|nr:MULTISPECIES: hypothetical protein [Bacteroidota]AQX12336.1 hypothetical protein BBD35_08105 [Elizabethkingia meningoseptica]MBG0513866.1 hypothetical protein [Elizabethkingia meningoseptica]ODM51040.1 hypothetical protein BES09_18230 [Elizabethkingia meningoseptica]OHT26259.1 hypothetical protein BFF93_18210 [Elizabethkingia meningoseptica]HAY3556598.1 hypothetical protein [Elizabethkingia meningoseptica]
MKNFPTFAIPNNESCFGKEKELIEGIWMKFFLKKDLVILKIIHTFATAKMVNKPTVEAE